MARTAFSWRIEGALYLQTNSLKLKAIYENLIFLFLEMFAQVFR